MVISKLKKDMLILEQKLIQLTRQRRPSFAASGSSDTKLPVMSSNLLYDMSSSSPSSSDSDSPSEACKRHSQSSAVDEIGPSPSFQDPPQGNRSDASNLVLGSMRGASLEGHLKRMRRTPRRRWL